MGQKTTKKVQAETIAITASPVDIYLVRELDMRGNWGIRAICLDLERANRYREMLQEDIDTDRSTAITVKIEKTWGNHLFGDSMYDSWYGKAPSEITTKERVHTINHFRKVNEKREGD